MNVSFCEKFTELIMHKWGDLFELDRNKLWIVLMDLKNLILIAISSFLKLWHVYLFGSYLLCL